MTTNWLISRASARLDNPRYIFSEKIIMAELHNLDPNRPNLCSALRSKDMFVWANHTPDEQRVPTGVFWCLYTQGPLGPDGKLAEPGNCDSSERGCHCHESAVA